MVKEIKMSSRPVYPTDRIKGTGFVRTCSSMSNKIMGHIKFLEKMDGFNVNCLKKIMPRFWEKNVSMMGTKIGLDIGKSFGFFELVLEFIKVGLSLFCIKEVDYGC
ncbi:MAG: hypothetical protein ABIC04_03995 [Nanoarchaeota archaeon]